MPIYAMPSSQLSLKSLLRTEYWTTMTIFCYWNGPALQATPPHSYDIISRYWAAGTGSVVFLDGGTVHSLLIGCCCWCWKYIRQHVWPWPLKSLSHVSYYSASKFTTIRFLQQLSVDQPSDILSKYQHRTSCGINANSQKLSRCVVQFHNKSYSWNGRRMLQNWNRRFQVSNVRKYDHWSYPAENWILWPMFVADSMGLTLTT